MAEWMYIVGSILILPAIIFALIAQFKVMGAFERYRGVPSTRGMTAEQVARKLLNENGCNNVAIERVNGNLTDHYDPRKKVVRLSADVYGSTSLAAIGIAAHECGHAIQDHVRYAPFVLRQLVIKSTSLVNKILLPLVIIGLIGSFFAVGYTIMGLPAEDFIFYLILGFCILYAISFAINLITLPTEYDASARAKKLLRQGNYLYDNDEYHAVSRVLGAAALTYLAALIVSLAYLLRFLGILMQLSGRRR